MNTLQISMREMVRRKRGVLLPLTVVWCVVSILVTVWTLRDASMQRVRRVMAQMGNNLLFVPRDASVSDYYAATGVQAEMPEDRAMFLATGCPVTRKHATHFVEKLQRRVTVQGAEIVLTGFHVIHGEHRPGAPQRRRSFLDAPLDKGGAIFGSEAARLAKVKTGDVFAVDGLEFTVTQVLPEFGVLDDLRVWVRLDEAQALTGKKGVIHGVDALGCLCAGPYFDSIVAETAQKLPDLRMVHWRLVADTREKSRQAVEGLGALVGLIAALLGAIAIWTAVTGELRERRSEIGVLSAMGAGGGRIFLLFLPKMALVGIVGGALGWGAGTALAVWAGPALAGLGPDVPVLVLIGLLPWAMVSGFLLALAAGGAAIWRAVRIDPVDALREL